MAEIKFNEAIGSLVREALKGLNPEHLKELLDIIADFIETKTKNTGVIFLINAARKLLKIEDEKYGLDKK